MSPTVCHHGDISSVLYALLARSAAEMDPATHYTLRRTTAISRSNKDLILIAELGELKCKITFESMNTGLPFGIPSLRYCITYIQNRLIFSKSFDNFSLQIRGIINYSDFTGAKFRQQKIPSCCLEFGFILT